MPVEHQPDFENVSLVPIDHDPFSADGGMQQAPSQQPQNQQAQPPPTRPATAVSRLYVGPATKIMQTPEEGESWDPDNENSDASGSIGSPASTPPQPKPAYDLSHFQPLGELKPATFPPTQQIWGHAVNALIDIGVPMHNAKELATRIGNLLSLTPLGFVGSTLDLIDAKRRDDLPAGIEAEDGLIPGARGAGRIVGKEVRALTSQVRLTPAAWAAKKGYFGVGTTANGGPTFIATKHLYPAAEGQRSVVRIKLTGSRRDDFALANERGGFIKTPHWYTRHHVDDFNPLTGKSSLQLVRSKAHKATLPHTGSVAQYEDFHDIEYRR